MFTRIPMEKSSQKPSTRASVKPGTSPTAALTDQQAPSPHPTPAISFNLGAIPIFPHDSARTPAPIQRKLAIGEQQGQKGTDEIDGKPAVSPSPARRLPEHLKARLEKLSGLSLDDVRVEYNSPQPATLNARAYTQGSRIKLGRGQEQHLAHEAWHAVQQKQGRVKAARQDEGVPINDNEQLEREADQAGAGTPISRSIQPAAVQPLSGSPANQIAPIQRQLWVGSAKKPVDAEKITKVMQTVQDIEDAEGSRAGMKSKIKDSLFKALDKVAFKDKKEALLDILQGWAEDEETEERKFTTWEKAVQAASAALAAKQMDEGLTEEEKAANKRQVEKLTAGLPSGEKIAEEDLTTKQKKLHRKSLTLLKKEASFATDEIYKKDSDKVLGVKRRKLHKAGQTLSRSEFNYGAYTGGTMPGKANAFVLGGSGLEADYKPLFEEIVTKINAGKKEGEKHLTDQDVAQLFLQELDGKDAFGTFPQNIKMRAHKIIGIIYNAELSRHSIAPLTAAGAFYAVASRKKDETEPGLVESFATGSHTVMRPLFAGKAGPKLMRGEQTKLTEEQLEMREVRASVDIHNYYNAYKKEGDETGEDENIAAFARRRTKEIIENLGRRHLEEEKKREGKDEDESEEKEEKEVKEEKDVSEGEEEAEGKEIKEVKGSGRGTRRKLEKDEEPEEPEELEERKKRKVEVKKESEEKKKRKVEVEEESEEKVEVKDEDEDEDEEKEVKDVIKQGRKGTKRKAEEEEGPEEKKKRRVEVKEETKARRGRRTGARTNVGRRPRKKK